MKSKKLKYIVITIFFICVFFLGIINSYAGNVQLSKSYSSEDDCNTVKTQYDLQYPSYFRSDCFEDTNGKYYYYLCDLEEDCENVVDNGSSVDDDNPYSKNFSDSDIKKLNNIIDKIEAEKSKYSESDFNNLIDTYNNELDKQLAKYPNIVGYLKYGFEKLKSNNNVDNSDSVDNFLCDLTGTCSITTSTGTGKTSSTKSDGCDELVIGSITLDSIDEGEIIIKSGWALECSNSTWMIYCPVTGELESIEGQNDFSNICSKYTGTIDCKAQIFDGVVLPPSNNYESFGGVNKYLCKNYEWNLYCSNSVSSTSTTSSYTAEGYTSIGSYTSEEDVCSTYEGECSDTDNGKNFATLGAVTDKTGVTKMDYCSGFKLVEYLCTSDNTYKTRETMCPYGCIDGACEMNYDCEETTFDGIQLYGLNNSSNDDRIIVNQGEKFKCTNSEWYIMCDNSEFVSIDGGDEKSDVCNCSDTDSGVDYYTYGEVTDKDGEIIKDKCFGTGKMTMIEYFCNSAGSASGQWQACQNGCVDGACVKGNTVVDTYDCEETTFDGIKLEAANNSSSTYRRFDGEVFKCENGGWEILCVNGQEDNDNYYELIDGKTTKTEACGY